MMIGVLFIYIDRIMIMMIALGDVHMTTNMVGAVQSMMPWPMMDHRMEMLNDGDSPIAMGSGT